MFPLFFMLGKSLLWKEKDPIWIGKGKQSLKSWFEFSGYSEKSDISQNFGKTLIKKII